MSLKGDPLELFDKIRGHDPLNLEKYLVNACIDGDIDAVIGLLQKKVGISTLLFLKYCRYHCTMYV